MVKKAIVIDGLEKNKSIYRVAIPLLHVIREQPLFIIFFKSVLFYNFIVRLTQ
jgi:hypothetical protein